MARSRQSFSFHDGTYPTSANEGPINVPAGNRVSIIRATGHLIAQTQVLSASGFPGNVAPWSGMYGVQRVSGGGTPLNIESSADRNSSQWHILEAVQARWGNAFTISAGVNGYDLMTDIPFSAEWKGSRAITAGSGADFYFSVGRQTTSSPVYAILGLLDIWYD